MSDASAAGAGAGIATAAVDRTTRAVIDGASAWGIRVGRLGIDASSSGELWVDSSGNTSGASSNTTAPITATLGAALTTGGPVRAASALGFGRVDSLTEAILASSGGEVLTLTTATDARVNAWSSDHSTVSADAAASALGTAVAVVLPSLTARASLDGTVVVDGGVLSLGADLADDSSASAVGGREGALAVGVGRRSSSAGLGQGASLTGTLDALRLTARSTTGAAGAATATGPASESLVVVVADSATVAGLADGATVGGVEDVTVAATGADTTTAAAGSTRGRAVVLVTVTTGARLGTGAALVLPGDLALTAEQTATARAAASLVALTLATHDVSATIGRAVTAGGSLSARATGQSHSLASTSAAASGAVAGTTIADVLAVRGVADALAAATGARGSSALPGLAPAPLTLGSAAVTVVRGSAVVELPALPVRAGGPIDLVALSGGSSAAGTGAPRDGGAAGGPAVSIVLAILPSKVRVPGPVMTDEDLLLQAGRGPPAQEQTTAPLDPTSIRIIRRPSTVEVLGQVTLTGPGSTLTVLQDTTAPVEAIGLPQQAPQQGTQQAPPRPRRGVRERRHRWHRHRRARHPHLRPRLAPRRRLRRDPRRAALRAGTAHRLARLRPARLGRPHRRGHHPLPRRPGADDRRRRRVGRGHLVPRPRRRPRAARDDDRQGLAHGRAAALQPVRRRDAPRRHRRDDHPPPPGLPRRRPVRPAHRGPPRPRPRRLRPPQPDGDLRWHQPGTPSGYNVMVSISGHLTLGFVDGDDAPSVAARASPAPTPSPERRSMPATSPSPSTTWSSPSAMP